MILHPNPQKPHIMRIIYCMTLVCLFPFHTKSQALTAITHVNIVDVKNKKIIPDKTIIIENDRIEKIGSNLRLPPGSAKVTYSN